MSAAVSGWRRPIITLIGLLVIYYSVPQRPGTGVGFFAGIAVTLLAVIVLAWTIAGQIRRQLRGGTEVALQTLVVAVSLVVVVFAYGFLTLERTRPGEVAGLETRTDALYFTVTTMTTVGFGDIHAAGQVARVLVLIQMCFNIVFVGALTTIVTSSLRRRADQVREQRSSTGGDDASA